MPAHHGCSVAALTVGGQLRDGQYSFNTATRRVVLSGPAQPNADQLEFNLPRDARLEGLPTIPLQITGGLGGAHAGHRIEADPMLAVAVPGTRVTYFVGMDPEIGGSYDYRWYCINDPASVRDGIPPRVDGPNDPRWENAQWAVPGRHTVVCELTFHGEGVPPRTERLEFFQQVNTEQAELATAFNQTQAPDYVLFRAGVELHNLELGGGMQDQHAANGPSIQATGANPAVPGTAPNYAFNTYTIAPSPNARQFHWYARCASWDLMPTQSFFGFSRVQVEGEDALELGTGAPTARFIIAQRNRYTIVCDELDARGHRIGRARYVQIVESQDQADERDRLQQYMQHADAAVATISPEKQVGLRAVYLNRETGERVPMQLYAGPSASDPHRVVLVDLLPGVDRIEYYGGKQLAGVFHGLDFSYAMAMAHRSHGSRDILSMLRRRDETAVLPDTVFVINEHLGSNLTYFVLTEGDDPPTYFWEEGDGGVDTAVRDHDAFSSFVLAQAKLRIEFLRRNPRR